MRVSIGSAAVLGLTDEKVDVMPTTCYIMVGDRCMNDCAFCTQARSSDADADRLSRVTWPEYDDELVYNKIIDAYTSGKIWRVCIQATGGSFEKALEIVERLNVPICISINANEEQVDRLIEAGAERVTIALDAATEHVFKKTKTGDFNKILSVLETSAEKHPGKIGTHLIVGLGETEKEMIERVKWMHSRGINIGLFAFTPVKGTKLENMKAPDIGVYRRIQAEYYKIKNNTTEIKPEAFQTPGCEGCNRPFYNESPSGIIYNYPRKLTEEEFKKCIEEMNSK